MNFKIDSSMLELIDQQGNSKLEKGSFKVSVGGSLPTKRSLDLGASPYVTDFFELK